MVCPDDGDCDFVVGDSKLVQDDDNSEGGVRLVQLVDNDPQVFEVVKDEAVVVEAVIAGEVWVRAVKEVVQLRGIENIVVVREVQGVQVQVEV
ncbi:hypothetical protein PMKS-003113 [Pichia membranifaciens]|uniref:Uncharacterized protein n=1 Tax=Pichia membranifaciens TaxID=4926 RepID=A0A1Q2YJ89_9ASCO|nr:hypothetical protein PMKS-003113 [Pichia membranifaciens]